MALYDEKKPYVIEMTDHNGNESERILYGRNRHEVEELARLLIENGQYKSMGAPGELIE